MTKRFFLLSLTALCFLCGSAQMQKVSMDGYIGGRVDDCIAKRVMGQNVDELVGPFLVQDEVNGRWASEFWGKWIQGAMASYQYNQDPALYAKIKDAVEKLTATQLADGYIGDYDKEHQLTGWDVWGRKYTLLGLVKWYRLSGDKKALRAAGKLLDYTISQIGYGKKHIYETGFYRGMPPSSILEPVMFMFGETKDKRYLDFAKYIVEDGENGHSLIGKCDVPVAERFPLGEGDSWWSFANGQKAYEMMSCYVGMLELYRVTGDELLLAAAQKAYRHILDEEINICGSGAALECWYGGKKRQNVPHVHTMETCVTFTWMQFNERLLDFVHDSRYADNIECTMYNALMASLKDDGSMIGKYTPLEGFRRDGEQQCGVNINCCNANAPRAFAMIPRVMYRMPEADVLDVNLYIPSKAEVKVGKVLVDIEQVTDYPCTDEVLLKVNPSKDVRMTLNLRVPGWSAKNVVEVNGEPVAGVERGTYCSIERDWKAGDQVRLKTDMPVKVNKLGDTKAVTRGPVVFARDSRFGDGDVDESVIILHDKGVVDAKQSGTRDGMWMTLTVPVLRGPFASKGEDDAPIHLCDFASACGNWDSGVRYRVWMPTLFSPDNSSGDGVNVYW